MPGRSMDYPKDKPRLGFPCDSFVSRLRLLAGMIFLAANFAVADPGSKAANGEESVNVLLIAIDDLNDWVGCLGGHPQAHTPNIDRLARRGILFANAHCPSTACNPSRAAIFSGKMPWQTGVWNNKSERLFSQQPDSLVFPRHLKRHGYQTMGTGKLMHSSGSANRLMFDDSYNPEQRWSPFTKSQVRYRKDEQASKATANPSHQAVLPSGESIVLPLNRMPSDRRPETNDGESFDWGGLNIEEKSMGDRQIADWAGEQIQQMDSALPFLLGVGFYRPHIPLFAPQSYFDRLKDQEIFLPPVEADDLVDLSETGQKWAVEAETAGLHSTVVQYEQWREAVKGYLACTTFVDAQVGRLIDSLDASPFADNTLVVLFSDHGWHLGEKQHWGKWTGWERSTRVPLVIVPPRGRASDFASAGTTRRQPVSLIDLYPTLCDLCGVPSPDGLDGLSLVDLLAQEQPSVERYALTVFDRGNVSIRDGRWRYIRYSDGNEELYDLESDPHEWLNLINKNSSQEVRNRFRVYLASAIQAAPANE
ncbi:sulfatase [bacterium]|nr:sulfatase [bacterium]